MVPTFAKTKARQRAIDGDGFFAEIEYGDRMSLSGQVRSPDNKIAIARSLTRCRSRLVNAQCIGIGQ
jgi:hypothetical protein